MTTTHGHGSMSIVYGSFQLQPSVKDREVSVDHQCRQQLSERTTAESVIENSSQIGPEPRLKDRLCHLILGRGGG